MKLRALLAAFALALAGCGEATLGMDPQNKILDIGNGAEPLSLDPAKAGGTWESNIIGNMFIGLTTDDAHGEVIPGMAERWEISEDGLTWTFHMRRADWSDGVPVTAYDFEFAWRRVMNPETLAEYAAILYPVKNAEAINAGKLPVTALGIHAIDERTLEIQLEHPAPYLPGILKHQTAYPVPKHVVEQWGDDWIKPAHVVVNGPYTLIKWWSNYVVHLRKNPQFFDAANVCLNELFFYPTSDPDVATRRIEAGELGWSNDFPVTKRAELERRLPGYVRSAPFMLTTFLSVNLKLDKFKDVGVRRALSMALDRDFLAKDILRGSYQPAYQLVPPNMPNYPKSGRLTWADEPIAQRRTEARRLLEAAGFGPNKPLEFIYSFRNTGDNARIAVVMQSDWHAIAPWVKVELRPTEAQIHYANLRAKNFEIGDGGWVGDYPDAQTYLFLMETRTGDRNWPGYSNPRYDDLVARSSFERDLAVRADMMREAEQIMLDDEPIIPMTFRNSRNLVNPGLTGFVDNLEDIHRARWMCIK